MVAIVWTDNDKGPDASQIPQNPNVDYGSPQNPVDQIFAREINVENINGGDGAPLNYSVAAYSAGLSPAVTSTPAALDFGDADPVVVLNRTGKYLLNGQVNLEFVGATFAANQVVTLKLRRTNNTPADIANSTIAVGTGTVTTATGNFASVALPAVFYSTLNTTDSITIFASVANDPSAGSLRALSASLTAVRVGD